MAVTVTIQPKSALKPSKAQLNVHGAAASLSVVEEPKATAYVPPLSDGIRVVQAFEYKEAAACLAEAFAEDDVARYFIDVPDRMHWTTEEKWKLHVEILEYVTYAHILKGLVTTVGDFEAVALW